MTAIDNPDPRRVAGLTGLLGQFNQAGVLDAADVHVAQTLGRLGNEPDERVLLAVALVVRALRAGSVCLPLSQARDLAARLERDEQSLPVDDLSWPDADAWLAAVAASPLVRADRASAGARPLRLHAGQLYLERDWDDQETVRRVLRARWAQPSPPVDEARLATCLDRLAGADAPAARPARQALWTAAHAWTTIVAGGPGTGKTTLVAALIQTLIDQADALGLPAPRIALAAPTGKAATRLAQVAAAASATAGVTTGTLHRLLGSRGPGRGFRHDARNGLPYDLIVVDEVSMVSLALMAALASALPPSARLVLVGDPDQLSSVDAGAVLADLVAAAMPRTLGATEPASVTLSHTWRFSGALAALADAIRAGDADRAIEVLTSDDEAVELIDLDPGGVSLDALPGLRAQLVAQARAVGAATAADASGEALRALDEHRLLCAHREGPYGASTWGRLTERLARTVSPPGAASTPWYPGRAVLMSVNQPEWGVANGDQGIVMAASASTRVVFGDPDQPASVPLSALEGLQPLYAMTVHKSQGSQYGGVTLVLPPPGSPLLTRELLYTAVTRARHRLRIVGLADSVRTAVTTPAWRASGLAQRLHDPD